jgi:hypothetical protein
VSVSCSLLSSSYIRFGGELPRGCDVMLDHSEPEPGNCLYFSNARAAITWFIQKHGPFDRSIISAYTCPSVPECLEHANLMVEYYDHQDVSNCIFDPQLKYLVLVPTTFGISSTIDVSMLAKNLPPGSAVIIDAAQTAFGHIEFPVPPGGAVISCPRKTLDLADGCVMALESVSTTETGYVANLPMAQLSVDSKLNARQLLSRRDESYELEALELIKRAEGALPLTPHRISNASRVKLARTDRHHHHVVRRRNFSRLVKYLTDWSILTDDIYGTPYCLPILVDDRENVLKRLHKKRVFATPLWPGARHNPAAHPVASDYVRRLVSLPIDQRYNEQDMDDLAQRVLESI